MANDNLSLELSASDVAFFTKWPDAMVNDYISRGADYMIVGEANPEGVVPANRTRQYFSTNEGRMYVNPVIGARLGWLPV